VRDLLSTRSRAIEALADQSLAVILATAKWFIASGHSELPRVGVIGGGAVGCAIVMKLLVHDYPSDRLALSTRQPERLPKCEALQPPAALALFEQVARHDDNARLARESDVLVLCIPPSQLKGVALQIKFAAVERTQAGKNVPLMVLSALCGVSRESIAKSCESSAVVRIQAMTTEQQGGRKGMVRSSQRHGRHALNRHVMCDEAVLETIVTALSALDRCSASPAGSDDGNERSARVENLLRASSPSTDEQVAPGIQWPTDWECQLQQRLLDDEAETSPERYHPE
jgi:hypothetical protein